MNHLETVHGCSPLILASQNGHHRVVEMLLRAPGVQVNQQDWFGYSSLMLACVEGYEKVAELLLQEQGIRANQADWEGATPLEMAAQERHGGIVEMLLRNDEVRAMGWDGWRPMRRKRVLPQLANRHTKKPRMH